MKVDLGEKEPRTLVAGLKAFYSPEELKGKTLVILSNLEPAKLRGVKSEGMLLAADHKDEEKEIVAFLTPTKRLPPGTPINSGMRQGAKKINYKQFSSMALRIAEVVDATHVDIGGKIIEVTPHKIETGERVAVYVDGKREVGPAGIILSTGTAIPIIPEKDIPIGAKIR